MEGTCVGWIDGSFDEILDGVRMGCFDGWKDGNMVGWWDDGWPGGLAIQSELLLVDWTERN